MKNYSTLEKIMSISLSFVVALTVIGWIFAGIASVIMETIMKL